MAKGKLYMIPCGLGDAHLSQVIPSYVTDVINNTHEYIVEDEKTARRFIKKAGYTGVIQDIVFHNMGKHADAGYFSSYILNIGKGHNIGVLSEAGCPGIADPGAQIALLAHEKNYEVVPLVGPSSTLLALMASGLNGQNFAFNGYLPKEQKARLQKLKELEKESKAKRQTQVFIETPFRNNNLFEDMLSYLRADTLLCVASNITSSNEYIKTQTIAEWKQFKKDLHKQNTVFAILG
jgi:16S rRNA (cytidine1402-2'-O)-methyltransferase